MNISQDFSLLMQNLQASMPVAEAQSASATPSSQGEIQDGVPAKVPQAVAAAPAATGTASNSVTNFIESIAKQVNDIFHQIIDKLNASSSAAASAPVAADSINVAPSQVAPSQAAPVQAAPVQAAPVLSAKSVDVSANDNTIGAPAPTRASAPSNPAPSGSSGFSEEAQTTAKTGPETADFAKRLVSHLEKELNISKNQATGIVANLMHESAGLNPGINQGGRIGEPSGNMADDNANGYGLAQWGGVRKTGLIDMAKKEGIPASSEKANVDFLVSELKGEYSGAVADLKKANTAAEATQIFCASYEKPSDPQMQSRLSLASQIA